MSEGDAETRGEERKTETARSGAAEGKGGGANMRSVTDVNGAKWRRANIRNMYFGNTEKRKAGSVYGVRIRRWSRLLVSGNISKVYR